MHVNILGFPGEFMCVAFSRYVRTMGDGSTNHSLLTFFLLLRSSSSFFFFFFFFLGGGYRSARTQQFHSLRPRIDPVAQQTEVIVEEHSPPHCMSAQYHRTHPTTTFESVSKLSEKTLLKQRFFSA